MWFSDSSYQKLSLKNAKVQIRVGAYEHEKQQAQTVQVDVELYRRHQGYRGEGLDQCMNYDPIYRYLYEEWPKRDHTDLLEAWAEDLVNYCLRDDKVEACLVRLRKPEIFPDLAIPEIEVLRYR